MSLQASCGKCGAYIDRLGYCDRCAMRYRREVEGCAAHVDPRDDRIATLERQLAERTRERDDLINEKKARSKIDPTTRLHNLCDALAESRGESPYDQESWDLVDADNKALRARAESAEKRERELREALKNVIAAWERLGAEQRPPLGLSIWKRINEARAALAAKEGGE